MNKWEEVDESMIDHLRNQFVQPEGQYSPIPFWFWNDALTKEELIRQLHDFHTKQVEGFVLHPRIGIPDTMPYLSDEFMELVEAVVQEADNLNMQVILYDEGMYPSGAANGEIVRRNPEYASRGLRMIELPINGPTEWDIPLEEGDRIVSAQAVRKVAERQVDINMSKLLKTKDGRVAFSPPDGATWSLVVFVDSFTHGTIRGIHYGQDDGERQAPRAADLLNPGAVELFIRLTHERYYSCIGKHFGTTVIAMFTDEPDLMGRKHRKGMMPWTTDFLKEFLAGGNQEEDLAALWFDNSGNAESIKLKFRKTVQKRLERVYYKPLHDWCEERGISLTGHPAASDDIGLLQYFHIPGQDIVWRWLGPEEDKGITGRHSTMGKCSSDAARHKNKRRNLNECFGVCGKGSGWALTADDMKWYLDWLFVRGVNLISPHAFYYSIEGKRLHERAPDVGPNNIWWPEYARFAQYIKRMSWVMTDSVNTTNLAVLCLADRLSWKLARPLFERQMEFNYLEEKLLQNDCVVEGGLLSIANQQYDTIILDEAAEFEAETWDRLGKFIDQGGTVVQLVGEGGINGPDVGQYRFDSLDQLIDRISDKLQNRPVFEPAAPSLRISHVIKDGIHLYVIVNEGEGAIDGRLSVVEQGFTEIWDAWNGAVRQAEAVPNEQGMDIRLRIERRECLIVAVDQQQKMKACDLPLARSYRTIELSDGWKVKLDGREIDAASLGSWTMWGGMRHFSGTLSYEIDVLWELGESCVEASLDLGEVHEMAHVFLNGHEIGAGLWKPYRFSVISHLIDGVNRLRVEVTNTLANRYDQAMLPSGLIGPIVLRTEVEINSMDKNG